MKIKYCFIQDFIDGQAPYLYKHIFSQSELSDENSERFRSILEIKIRKESIV